MPELAKPCFDFGLFTRRAEVLAEFWIDEVGATLNEVLTINENHRQFRFNLLGSVLKINSLDHLPDVPRCGFRELILARPDIQAPRSLADPDGNRVVLVPSGFDGVRQCGIKIAARSHHEMAHYFEHVVGLTAVSESAFAVGDGTIIIEEGEDVVADLPLFGPGWRYITLQVNDVREVHQSYLSRGGRPGTEIEQFQDIARFTTVRDPDGNWIEYSQNASLVGPLGA